MKLLKQIAEAGISLVYPDACQLCQDERAGAGQGYVCEACWGKLRFIRAPFCDRCGLPFEGAIETTFECSNCCEMELHFESARAAVVANEFVLGVIHQYKYNNARWFECFLGDLLMREAGPELLEDPPDWIVPVPLHGEKEREREFNQAGRLALFLGKATGVPVRSDLVRRVAPTRTQTLLDRAARAANVRNAFAVRDSIQLHGERVLLIDDVLTTGATTSACARALRRAGAGSVRVWTVARGL